MFSFPQLITAVYQTLEVDQVTLRSPMYSKSTKINRNRQSNWVAIVHKILTLNNKTRYIIIKYSTLGRLEASHCYQHLVCTVPKAYMKPYIYCGSRYGNKGMVPKTIHVARYFFCLMKLYNVNRNRRQYIRRYISCVTRYCAIGMVPKTIHKARRFLCHTILCKRNGTQDNT